MYTTAETAITTSQLGPLSSSSPKPPNQKPICTMNEAIEAKKLAIVITITSRFWTWVSSWPSTASSSASSSRSRIPVVAQTVAVLGERPTANALGIDVWAIATRGLGRLA